MGLNRQTPTLTTVIQQAIDGRLVLVNGGFFARVTAWDSAAGSVDVEAYFQLEPTGTDDDPEPAPETVTVEGVPLLYPSVGGWTIRAAPSVGDIVWCSGCSRSLEEIDDWRSSGDPYLPSNPRILALDDVVASPVSWGSGATSNLVIEGHGASVELTTGGDVLLNGGGAAVGRVGDSTSSSAIDDPVFWTWLAAAAVVLAGLGVVAPVPTSLAGKISTGSGSVEAG